MGKDVKKLHRRFYGFGRRLPVGRVAETYNWLARIRTDDPIIREDVFRSELVKALYERLQ